MIGSDLELSSGFEAHLGMENKYQMQPQFEGNTMQFYLHSRFACCKVWCGKKAREQKKQMLSDGWLMGYHFFPVDFVLIFQAWLQTGAELESWSQIPYVRHLYHPLTCSLLSENIRNP